MSGKSYSICGIKLTHDAAVALIEDGRLILSYEIEKLGNNFRHSEFALSFAEVDELLGRHQGRSLAKVDQFVLDGWGQEPTPYQEEQTSCSIEFALDRLRTSSLSVAKYGYVLNREDVLERSLFSDDSGGLRYSSYMHVSGHIFSAYCTSPFAARNEPSLVLIWDGGTPPQLFSFDPTTNRTEILGPLLSLLGYIYINFPHEYPPFNRFPKELGVAGKVMAYIAKGKVIPQLVSSFDRILDEIESDIAELPQDSLLMAIATQRFVRDATARVAATDVSPDDAMATFHHFVQERLLSALTRRLAPLGARSRNLCFAGGCALNIKWNSALRSSGLFDEVWVPPFPNDSGTAIGAACCEMVRMQGVKALEWSVYSGPKLVDSSLDVPGWRRSECSLRALASFLHTKGEPVVFLNGRAELGPRALGNRSILAPAHRAEVKDQLNLVKDRESYRPVAPICLEAEAPEIFDPGVPDPYMLFDHSVRPNWKDRIPAVLHLDGTARLQTVNVSQNREVFELLTHYKELSGIPLLCNTSANAKGRGFFPDVRSALEWGRLDYVWSEGYLYSKHDDGRRNGRAFGS